MAKSVLLAITVFLSLQNNPEITIWSNACELQWSDYKSPPNYESAHSASSECGFDIKYEIMGDSLYVSVLAYFDKSKSWVKPEKKSDALLSHERVHFDIAELFARKYRKGLLRSDMAFENYERIIISSFEKNMIAYKQYQNTYDQETQFSRKNAVQKQWERQIKKDLDSHKAFSAAAIVLKIK